MNGSTVFDYYYGDESSQFSFYRIPRQLVAGQQFKKISTDAKLLYGLLLDRMGLSARNGWYDDAGRVYIFYTLDEIQEDLNCGHEKAVKLLNDHRSKLDELSKYLYEKETITGEEFMKILNLEKAQDKTQD